MKRYFTNCLPGLLGLLFTFQAAAQKPSCDSDSYSSEVLKEEQISETCTEYEIKVSYDGTRSFGLSHYSIGIPCGEVKDVSNSENWKQVFGKDPTTGVYGLKIDNISGFGERGADSFTIKFTWCADNSCARELGVVSYKAGRCVDYDTLSSGDDPEDDTTIHTCSTLLASLQKKNVTCSAGTDGQLQVVIQDGQEPFVYSWSTGATTAMAQSLSAGMYAVTISDANGNTLTLNEVVSSPPPIVITESVVNPSCSGLANGSIELAITGGIGEYSFAWSNGSTQQNLTSLIGGLYTVTVTDSVGCSVQKTFMLTNSTLITAGVLLRHPSCTQTNGSIDITPSGGTAPYTYLWSTGATTEDIQNASAGIYTVKIMDATGCSVEKNYTLRINNTLAITQVVTPTSCLGDDSGAINVSVFGGTAPYTFQWQDGPTTEDRSGLTAGTYKVTVTDASGCTAQMNISVFKKPLQVNSQVNQPACAGELGSISVTASGVPPYTYSWSNGETDDAIADLPNGIYSVTVTDASGCSRTLLFAILTPSAIDVTSAVSNAQCGSEGAFAIDLSVTGGKVPYTYLWSTGATSQNVSGLNAGTYSVLISDALGCTVTKEFIADPVSIGWSCLIIQPTASIVCGSVGNLLSAAVGDATDYQWTVSSTDNSWNITSGSNDSSVVYTAGSAGSSATFTLAITKNGCTQTCSYTTASNCVERDNTGGGDPSSSDPCVGETTTPPTAVVDPPQPVEEPITNPVEEPTTCKFKLEVYPNPFKENLNFEWTAPKDDYVQIEILDKLGNRLTMVYEGKVFAGRHYNFDWSAIGLQDHIYFYRYTSTTAVDQGKLLRK